MKSIYKAYKKRMKLSKKLRKTLKQLARLEQSIRVHEYLRQDEVCIKSVLNSIYGKSVYVDTDSCKERKET